jgi:hypothetical protein
MLKFLNNVNEYDDEYCKQCNCISVNNYITFADCFMKMNVYSLQEMTDMHLFYGHANDNSKEARSSWKTF